MVLVVDLDGTYLKNDFFAEQYFKKMIENPFFVFIHMLSGFKGILELKKKLLGKVTPNYPISQLVNPVVADFIRKNRSGYRSVVIVSASPDEFVKRILKGDSNFESVHGSTDVNLKGEKKLGFIREKFGDDFHYIGNSSADIPILKSAKKGFMVRSNGIHEYK